MTTPEMGAGGASDSPAGPLSRHLCLQRGVKGQDGGVQRERAQTGTGIWSQRSRPPSQPSSLSYSSAFRTRAGALLWVKQPAWSLLSSLSLFSPSLWAWAGSSQLVIDEREARAVTRTMCVWGGRVGGVGQGPVSPLIPRRPPPEGLHPYPDGSSCFPFTRGGFVFVCVCACVCV